jgi:cysteinyl-tRNA synthetase
VEKFDEAMDDDFNTADAIAAIFELVKFANTNAGEDSSKAFLNGLKEEVVMLSDICGLIVDKQAELLDADIQKLIEERQAARKARDFARADAIRDELLAQGIALEDTREGVKIVRL